MANYNPYNYNPYIQDLQAMRDRIDKTVQQYQQNQNIPQQPQVTQNFQLAPMNNSGLDAKYVNNIDEVKNTFVMREGLFINREMTTLWVKNINGDIKTYSLTEVVEADPKDNEIKQLKKEIEDMKSMMNQQTETSRLDNKSEKKGK